MKAPILFSLLLLPFAGMAQQDSIRSNASEVQPDRHSLTLSAGSNGMKVQVQSTDTNTVQKGDTIRITSKRKLIRIITTPRIGIDTVESFEQKLSALKRERRNLFSYWAGLELGMNSFVTTDGRIGDGPESGPLAA
jgi:hypothetical protein